MEAAPAQAVPGGDLHNLDVLRAVAVLLVYVFHLAIALGHHTAVDLGRIGVVLFFVHTSFVLMMSLERLAARGEPLMRSFYLRRFFRIYPLSCLCVLLIVAFHLPRAPWWPYTAPDATTLLANLLLFMNLVYAAPLTSVLWSLPYEVQMYVLLPGLFLFGRRFGARGVALLWLLACVLGAVLPEVSGRLDLFFYGPCFVAGVLAYFLRSGMKCAPQWPAWAWPLALCTGALVFHLCVSGGASQAGHWLMCLLVGAALPLCREMPVRWLQTACALIARYSYGVYLTHLFAMWGAFVLLRDAAPALQWALLAVLSVGLPVLLFHWVETPFIRLGARLAKRLSRAPLRQGAALPPTC